MNIAVCLYGQPRFCDQGIKYLFDFCEGIHLDFYIHSWGNETNLNELNLLYNPISIKVEPPKTNFVNIEKYIIDENLNKKGMIPTISPLYSIREVGKLLEESDIKYDFVILARTDIAPLNSKLSSFNLGNGVIYSSYVNGSGWIIAPNKENYIDTKFILSDKNAILHMCKLYDNLLHYHIIDGVPMCHHRLYYHHLKKLNMRFDMLYLNDSNINGGWYYIRNGYLSDG
jgi:hypothetical protein